MKNLYTSFFAAKNHYTTVFMYKNHFIGSSQAENRSIAIKISNLN